MDLRPVPQVPPRRRRRTPFWAVVCIVFICALLVSTLTYWGHRVTERPRASPSVSVHVENLTGYLGSTFRPGSIQGFGYNSTSTLLTGIGVYNRSTDFSLPALAKLNEEEGDYTTTNLTSIIHQYFYDGGTYGGAWNGTAWLLTGQATWGDQTLGTAVFVAQGGIVNLTGSLGDQFFGGGVWISAWNGTGWLIAGNSSRGAELASVQGSDVTNLSGLLPAQTPGNWIQLLAWNGTAWVVGGHGVFGTLNGNRFTNLLPMMQVPVAGVYGAAWDGAEWLIGGGPPARLYVLSGQTLRPGPGLPPNFNEWVSSIATVTGGFLVTGADLTAGGSQAPALCYAPSDNGAVTNLTSAVQPSFSGGSVAYLGPDPPLGPSVLLLVGWEDYDVQTGHSYGVVVSATVVPG
jgi:hypothetical protein